MASSPSTFPFLFPPTSFGFGPPPCAPYTFPSAAAYSPPGCYFTSHSPFYGAPSAYPYAASFPAPASNFFPILPNSPPPAADPTPSTAAIHSVAPLCVLESHSPFTPRNGPVYQINQSSSVVHPANPEFKAQIGEMKEDGSATVRHDCDPQSEKSGSNPYPSVASAPSPALDPWAQQNGDFYSTKAASNNHTTTSEFKVSTRRPPVTSPPSPRGWASTPLKLPDTHPVLPDYTSQGGNITTSNGAGSASISDEKFVHKHTGPRTLPMVNASPNHHLFRDDDAAVQAAAHERVPAKNAIRHRRQRELLNLQARLDQQQARERNSFETIKDGLVKLTSMASQLTVALGMQTTKVLATEPSPTVVFAPSTAPATSALRFSDMGAAASSTVNTLSASFAYPTPTSDSTVSAALAYVAPQVLDELPTPQSGYESYTYGHPNPIPSSVHGESTNFSEQNLDGRPQPYGFHNLNRQSVFLADGTERSYFTLPADYPLERAVPEPLFAISDDESDGCSIGSVQAFAVSDEESDGCSNKSVHVFNDTPEQQIYEEDKSEYFQPLKCFSKTTFSAEKPTVGTVGIFSLKNDARACNCIALKASNSVATMSKQLSIEHCKRELRLLWDPGASLPLLACKTQHPGQDLQPATHATTLAGSNGTCFNGCQCLPFCIQKIYVYWESETGVTKYFSWDPGVLSILVTILDKYTVPSKLQYIQQTAELLILTLTDCLQYMAPNNINSILQDTSFILQRAAYLTQDNYLCFLYCNSVLETEYHRMRYVWAFSLEKGRQVQWDPGIRQIIVNVPAVVKWSSSEGLTHAEYFSPNVYAATYIPNILVSLPLYMLWDPGLFTTDADATKLLCAYVYSPKLVRVLAGKLEGHTIIFPSLATKSVQVMKHKQPLEFLLLADELQNMSDFSDGQVAYMPRSPTINSTKFLRHMFTVLSRWLSSLENSVKLQWDPGIAFIYQQAVQKNYLQIWEIDIIFITFLPP